jgi:hypothetical protein
LSNIASFSYFSGVRQSRMADKSWSSRVPRLPGGHSGDARLQRHSCILVLVSFPNPPELGITHCPAGPAGSIGWDLKAPRHCARAYGLPGVSTCSALRAFSPPRLHIFRILHGPWLLSSPIQQPETVKNENLDCPCLPAFWALAWHLNLLSLACV